MRSLFELSADVFLSPYVERGSVLRLPNINWKIQFMANPDDLPALEREASAKGVRLHVHGKRHHDEPMLGGRQEDSSPMLGSNHGKGKS